MVVRRKSAYFLVPLFVAVALYVIASFNEAFYSRVKWMLLSHAYQHKLSALPASSAGEFRHIEWDGWGFPGAGNTVVYLVYDPSNSLQVAATSQHPGKSRGLPCEVYSVNRLQSGYYIVQFYTDTDWQHCAGSG